MSRPQLPPVPTDKQWLEDYSAEHLYYESTMLHHFAGISFPTEPLTAGEQYAKNAAVEAFAGHLRNLIEFFFYGTSGKRSDVRAHHFVLPAVVAAWSAPGVLPGNLERSKYRADRELAHLTTGRYPAASSEKGWPRRELMTALRPRIQHFLKDADGERLAPRARDALNQLAGTAVIQRGTQ